MEKRTFFLVLSVFILLLTPFTGKIGAPPAALRFIYLVGVVSVTWLYDKNWLPAVITTLYTISKFGCSVAYMPTEIWYYIVLFAGFCFFTQKKLIRIPKIIYIYSVWVIIVDYLNSFAIYDNSLSLILIGLVISSCSLNSAQKNVEMFSIGFVVISLIISIEYIFASLNIFTGNIVSVYADVSSAEDARVMWADPNYLGCVVSMGGLVAFSNLFKNDEPWFMYAISAIVIGLSFIMLLMNASRGALSAFLVGFFVLFLTTKTKPIYKLLLFVIIGIFVVWLYDNAYFDLIENRIANDSGGGSGRTNIWMNKWQAFESKSIIEKIIGIGYFDGYRIAQATSIVDGKLSGGGFHNEFLAHFVDYGFIGFMILLSFFYYPIKLGGKLNSLVLSHLFLLVVACMTLEPFSLGMYIYYVFWFYILQKSKELYEYGKNNKITTSKDSLV